MMRLTQSILAASCLAFSAGALLPLQAEAATTWRLSSKLPPDSFEGGLYQTFADRVNEYTDGEISIQIYPSEQLGDAQTVLEQVSSGIIDIFAEDITYLESFNRAVSWVAAPFLFDDRTHWRCFLGSDYFQGVVQSIADDDDITVIGDIGPWSRGFRVLASNEPVESFDDVQGLDLRLWDNQLMVDIWTALGTDPIVLAWTDVYQSLQTGIVDAVTSPAALVEPMKFYEVAPYIVRTNEFNQAIVFMINKGSWEAITDQQRQDVTRAYEEVSQMATDGIDQAFQDTLATMESQGATYQEIDTSPFVEAASDIYQRLQDEGRIPDGLLDAVEASRNSCQ